MKLTKGSAAAKAWGRKMARQRAKKRNAVKFRSYSPKKRAALRRYVKKYSGGKMKGARRALFHGLVRSGEHSVRTFKRRGLKAWLRGNPSLRINIAMGFKDSRGVFHPVRASRDYDDARAYSGGLERERSSMMREAMRDVRGGYTPKSERIFKTKKRAPLTHKQREDFAKRMYEARSQKRRGSRRSFRNPGGYEQHGEVYITKKGKRYIIVNRGGFKAVSKTFRTIAAARKFLTGVRSNRSRRNPITKSGRFHKFYEKLLSITLATDKGPRELRSSKNVKIYGDKADRRRVVLVGDRFPKELEGAKVLRVDATGNTTKRNDVKRNDKFYHPFTSAARLSHDSAGHLVIKSSRPLWTPRDY